MSSFVSHITHDLSERIVPPVQATPPSTPGSPDRGSKDALRAVFLSLSQQSIFSHTQQCLDDVAHATSGIEGLSSTDNEAAALQKAIVSKLAVDVYGKALDVFLDEARQIENEMDWWADVERSRSNIALYFVQTLPSRLRNLAETILTTIRSRNISLQPLVFTPSSLRKLFPSSGVLRPNALTVALFPHLRAQPLSIALVTGGFPSASAFVASPRKSVQSAFHAFIVSFASIVRGLATVVILPLQLTSDECSYKRRELESLRDEKAETLGSLADMRDFLASAVEETSSEEALAKLAFFSSALQRAIEGQDPYPRDLDVDRTAVEYLRAIANGLQPPNVLARGSVLRSRDLARPSRLTLLWPRLVLLPPLALYIVRTAYASRWSLHELAVEAWETMRGFWEDWLLGPLRDVVETVRAGGEDGVIITKESVQADLDSLERMALALAREKLHYDPVQMNALSRQIQLGDLTPVMQIYEEDIKSPFKSAVGGTLLRTLFIQVQKAKVDIDQALAGIDKLLKSQELTFAFVGVAPALVIVYGFTGYLWNIWTGGRGRGRYGGKHRRASVWLKMRRIERLLIAQPKSHRVTPGGSRGQPAPSIPPLTSGLLLLSVSHLRTYAETYLPANSRLREGFLEDVVDLENPALGRAEKLRVLDRMWRSWGEVLGWSRAADPSSRL